jgi:hypothetical protein
MATAALPKILTSSSSATGPVSYSAQFAAESQRRWPGYLDGTPNGRPPRCSR